MKLNRPEKNVLMVLATALVVLGVTQIEPQTEPLPIEDSVVAVFCDNGNMGTGFIYKGKIVTASHVIGGATAIQVTFRNKAFSPAEVWKVDKVNDLAILTCDYIPEHPTIRAGAGKRGEKVHYYGHPIGAMYSYGEGYIMSENYKMAENARYLADIQVFSGASGSPVFQRDRLIGVVLGLISGTSICLISPVEHLESMFE